MLAFHHAPSSSPNPGYYPAIPSPLSPRSANIHGPRHAMRMSDHEKRTSGDQENRSTRSTRKDIKRAPVPKGDELREKRRRNFLKKVEEQREEKRFEVRGDDIMRLDFLQRQRAWEAERAREAAFIASQPEEVIVEEYELPGFGGSQKMQMCSSPLDEDEVEEFVKDEQAELEAMLENMPNEDTDAQSQHSDNLWSDDADYDELFSEVLSREQQQTAQGGGFQQHQMNAQEQPQQARIPEDDEMDMS